MSILEHQARNIVGMAYDHARGSEERFAAARELRIVAIADGHGRLNGVNIYLPGTPNRGMVTITDITYGNRSGIDLISGKRLKARELTSLMQFLGEVAGCNPTQIPAGFSWSSLSKPAAN